MCRARCFETRSEHLLGRGQGASRAIGRGEPRSVCLRCETVSVESGFRKIKASMTIGGRFIDGIQFLRDGSVNFDTFGKISGPI